MNVEGYDFQMITDAMTEHRIRLRAYEIYLSRISNPPLADWLQAEREILEEIRRSAGTRLETLPVQPATQLPPPGS